MRPRARARRRPSRATSSFASGRTRRASPRGTRPCRRAPSTSRSRACAIAPLIPALAMLANHDSRLAARPTRGSGRGRGRSSRVRPSRRDRDGVLEAAAGSRTCARSPSPFRAGSPRARPRRGRRAPGRPRSRCRRRRRRRGGRRRSSTASRASSAELPGPLGDERVARAGRAPPPGARARASGGPSTPFSAAGLTRKTVLG